MIQSVGLRLLLASALALAGVMPAAAQKVGTAGAVNTRSVSTPPGAGERVIEIGAQIVRNERIETSASGSLQVLFIDKTSLTVGPNSSIVIDQFVFNPAENAGSMSVRLGKGLMRIVGGQVTHTGGATVTTPAATIGVRGGIATIKHCTGACDTPGTRAILHFGSLTIAALGPGGIAGDPQSITRPGFAATVGGGGAPPTPPARAAPSEVADANSALTSRPSQQGGSATVPSDANAGQRGVGTSAAADPGAVQSRQGQNASNGTGTTSTQSASTNRTPQVTQQIAQDAQQVTSTRATAQTTTVATPQTTTAATGAKNTSVPTATPTAPTPINSVLPAYSPTAFVLTTSAGAGSAYPFLTASFVASGQTAVTTPIYGYRPGNAEGTARQKANVMQANLIVTGQGAAQSSTISLMTGQIGANSAGSDTFSGGFSASSRTCAACAVTAAFGSVSSPASSITTGTDGLPAGQFTTTQDRFSQTTGAYTASQAHETDATAARSLYPFTQTVSAGGTVPSGLGTNRPDATLLGYSGGVMQTTQLDSTGRNVRGTGSPYAVVGVTAISLVASSGTMGASMYTFGYSQNANATNFTVLNYGTSPVLELSNAVSTNGNNVAFDLSQITSRPATGTDPTRSAYVDYNTFGARSEMQLDPITGARTATSSINGSPLTASAPMGGFKDGVSSLMVTADAVGANTSAFLSRLSSMTVTPCQCDYTRWGFWSASIYQNDTASNSAYLTRGNLNLWVAGVPSAVTDMPTTGSATYVGHTIASISNGGGTYLAAGTFRNEINFGTRTGQVAINGLDGANYTGPVSYAANSTLFYGTLNGILAGSTPNIVRQAFLNGMFYQGPASIGQYARVGEMGGNISLSGPNNYMGSGIFAGRIQ